MTNHDALQIALHALRTIKAGGYEEAWQARDYASAELAKIEAPKPAIVRRADWHYDSQGYCDNPGRGY